MGKAYDLACETLQISDSKKWIVKSSLEEISSLEEFCRRPRAASRTPANYARKPSMD
jgi:hypothetical protein